MANPASLVSYHSPSAFRCQAALLRLGSHSSVSSSRTRSPPARSQSAALHLVLLLANPVLALAPGPVPLLLVRGSSTDS